MALPLKHSPSFCTSCSPGAACRVFLLHGQTIPSTCPLIFQVTAFCDNDFTGSFTLKKQLCFEPPSFSPCSLSFVLEQSILFTFSTPGMMFLGICHISSQTLFIQSEKSQSASSVCTIFNHVLLSFSNSLLLFSSPESRIFPQ